MMNLDLNFNEDELFWGLLLQSDASSMMLTATDIDCIKDFKVLKSLIERQAKIHPTLCRFVFVKIVQSLRSLIKQSTWTKLTLPWFVVCKSCRLDGQEKAIFFTAGSLCGPFSTHDVSFDTIQLFNGLSTVHQTCEKNVIAVVIYNQRNPDILYSFPIKEQWWSCSGVWMRNSLLRVSIH
jgi:hypothetical protein